MAPAGVGAAAGRPVVLVGAMGAGKTTVGRLLAGGDGGRFEDTDETVERSAGRSIPELWRDEGEPAFRRRERDAVRAAVEGGRAVVAVGGGALGDPDTRELLARRAHVIWLDADAARLWDRVQAQGAADRPLVGDRDAFLALVASRRGTYAECADAVVSADGPPDQVAEACRLVPLVRPGAVDRLAELAAGRRVAVIADERVATRVADAGAVVSALAGGEDAKTVAGLERLWRALGEADLERRDLVVAAGGGTVTDVAGFAAATFRRGLGWVAVPTTLLGQVDAAIGGKTAINVGAKNDVGAFHLPEAVLADPLLLDTLPAREWAFGFAEVVKTALLAGGPLLDLVRTWPPGPGGPDERTALVRGCAAYKTAVVAADPEERGLRAVLNLGHTIGHGLERAAGYGALAHGQAVAVGLSAALWLSVELAGLDAGVLEEGEAILRRHGLPVRAPGLDAALVEAAMRGDKKRAAGRLRFVLLEAPGRPVHGVDPGDACVAAAVRRAVSPA